MILGCQLIISIDFSTFSRGIDRLPAVREMQVHALNTRYAETDYRPPTQHLNYWYILQVQHRSLTAALFPLSLGVSQCFIYTKRTASKFFCEMLDNVTGETENITKIISRNLFKIWLNLGFYILFRSAFFNISKIYATKFIRNISECASIIFPSKW